MELGLPQGEVLYQHLVSPRVHAVFCLGTALAIGRVCWKGRVGCEAVKPQFSQDTMAPEEAVVTVFPTDE